MQEVLKKVTSEATESLEKTVMLCIQSRMYALIGSWKWDMQSNAVYCSDVMDFPKDWEGTKGIIHPDDLPQVQDTVQTLQAGIAVPLQFRLITTYGEVRDIAGQRVVLDADATPTEDAQDEEFLPSALKEYIALKEHAFLNIRSLLADAAEKLENTGSWYINQSTGQAWYSDQVYRIHGVIPQSLNPHPHTFNSFIHPDERAIVLDALERAYTLQLPLHLQYRIIRAGGEVKTLQQVTHWQFNNKGELLLCGLLRDLTDALVKEGEQAAAESGLLLHSHLLRLLEQQGASGYWFINLATRKIVYSDNYLRLHGLKQPIVSHTNTFIRMVHPDDQEDAKEALERMFREHQYPEIEFRIIRPDGKQRHLKQSGKLLFHQGADLIMLIAANDITVQKTLEGKLHEARADLDLQKLVTSHISEAAAISTMIWQRNGEMHWSDEFYRLLGYRQGAEPTKSILQRSVHPSDLEAFKKAVALVQEGQAHEDVNFRVITRTGVRQMKLSFKQISEVKSGATLVLLQDVSEEVVQQERLQENNYFSRLLTEAIGQVVIFTNVEYRITAWNTAAAQKTGVKATDAIGANLFDVLPHLNEQHFLSQLHTALMGETVEALEGEYRYFPRPHSYSLIPLKNEEEEVTGILHLVQDVSAEIELQQRFGERLNFIESLVEASVDRIVVLDSGMNYLYWNKRAEEYYAIQKERVIGRNILEIFPGFRNDPSYQEFRRVLKGETIRIPATVHENGTEYFETYLSPIKNGKGEVTAVLWVARDLSKELQLLEKERRAQQQLAEEHRRLEEAQAISHIGSFEWIAGSEHSFWSDELYRINGLEPQSEVITLSKVDQFIHPEDLPRLESLRNQSSSTPGTYSLIHRIVRRNGELRWVNHQWESYADEEGEVMKVTGTLQDITEQVVAQQKLQANESLLRRAEEVARTGSYEAELATMTFNFSAGMYLLFGEEPYSFQPTLEFVDSRSHPDDAAAVQGILAQAIIDKQPYYYTRRIYHKDGSLRTLEAHGKVVTDSAGNAVKFLGLVQDITERKKAEEEILRLKDAIAQKATGKYTTLFNSIDEAVAWCEMVTDKSGRAIDYRLLELNPAYEKMTGLTKEASTGKTAKELVPTLEDWWVETYAKVAFERESIRFEHKIDELGRWFNVYASPVGDKKDGQFVIVYADVTERKHAEEALRHSEERFRSLVTATSDTIYKMSPDWKLLYGLEGKNFLVEASNKNCNWLNDYIPEHEKPRVLKAIDEAIQNKSVFELEHQLFDADGNLTWTYSRAVPKLDENGDIIEWFGAASDISERKQLEEQLKFFNESLERQVAERTGALQQSNNLLQTIFDTSLTGICLHEAVYDEQGNIVDFCMRIVNRQLEQLTGRQDLKDKLYAKEFPGIKQAPLFSMMVEAMQTGSPKTLEYPYHYDGFDKTFVSTFVPSGKYLVATNLDITDRKKAEEEVRKNLAILQQAEDLAQIGSWEYEIATGVFKWSEGMYRLFNLPKDVKVTPDSYLDFAVEEDRSIAKRIINNLKKKHKPFEEMMQIKRDDANRLLKIKASVVNDEEGAPQKIVGVDIDITDIKNAEKKVKETEDLLQQTTLATPDSITIYSLVERQPIYLNNCLGEWVGYTNEELVAMGFEGRLKLIHPDDQQILERINETMRDVADGEMKTVEYRLQTRDGKTIWVRNRSKVFRRDDKGVPTHIMSILQDFTNEVLLRQALTQRSIYAESLIDASLDRLLVLDAENNIIGWNKRCEEAYHARKEEVMGKNFFQVFPKLIKEEAIVKGLQDARKGEVVRLPVRKEIYSNVFSEIFYVPLKDENGNVYAVLNVLHDITKTFVAQEELKEVNKTLAKKNIELENKNEEITSFAFIASHDLREPLRKIHTFSDWLLSKEGELLSLQGKDFLLRMNLSVKRLSLLIDDILALTQIHAVKDAEEDIDLTELLGQVEADMHDWIETKGGIIMHGKLHSVRGIRRQLQFLFRNLISNAMKFSNEGELPKLTIFSEIVDSSGLPEHHRDEREYLKLSFIDNGIGIDEKYKKKIFQMFQRLSGAKHHEGTGMGLAICKKIMENHHGFITVVSEEQKGSVFCCYFPLG